MAKLIGVYGGSFNPPHTGHIEAAKAAMKWLGLEKVLFVPSNIPPHKKLSEDSPDGIKRAELVRLCIKAENWAEVSKIELEREGVSYTADTLRKLMADEPEVEFCLLVGTDMFDCLDKWHDAKWILENIHIAVFSRSPGDTKAIEIRAWQYRENFGSKIDIVQNDAVEISSTELRKMLQNRRGSRYMPQDEYAFVIKNGIYGAKPDFQWLREQAYAMLKPKRISHVQGTEKAAVELAELYGENVDDARTAAILHDITKKLDLSEQLILCREYDIIIDSLEKASEKLLHSKTGAYLSRDRFGISNRVFEAIRWHTTGKAGMTMLEKIIYMADYIEPTRDFDGVEELRRLAYKDIDAAMLLGLKMSEQDLLERGVPVHPQSREALDYFEHLEVTVDLEDKR